MTREQLHKIARKVSVQKQIVEGLGLVNVYGMAPERKADLDARYTIERDILAKLDADYRKALNEFVKAA